MSVVWTIASRELRSFFRVPMGWVVIALYLVLTGYVFAMGVVSPGGPATLRDFFLVTQVFVLILTPAVSMRLISDELRGGTLESLMTALVAEGLPANLASDPTVRNYLRWRSRISVAQRMSDVGGEADVIAERDPVLAEAIRLLTTNDTQAELFSAIDAINATTRQAQASVPLN